jgi:phage-related protein
MFNRTYFNITPFNRPLFNFVYVGSLLEGMGGLYPSPVIEAIGAVLMQGVGALEFTVSTGGAVLLSGVGGFSIEGFKELYGSTLLEGVGDFNAEGSRYEVKAITFTGDFSAGDTIKIDMDKFSVTLNGQSSLSAITGDFFNLLEGENKITYSDSSTNRSVIITFEYRDRWL